MEINEIHLTNSERPVVYQNSIAYYPPYSVDEKYFNVLFGCYEENDSFPQKFLKNIFEEAHKIILKLNLSKDIMVNFLLLELSDFAYRFYQRYLFDKV